MMSKPTDTPTEPTELQIGIEMLKTVFRSGDRKAIEAVMGTLDVAAIKATEWAKEQKERRAKLVAIPGGGPASKQREPYRAPQ